MIESLADSAETMNKEIEDFYYKEFGHIGRVKKIKPINFYNVLRYDYSHKDIAFYESFIKGLKTRIQYRWDGPSYPHD